MKMVSFVLSFIWQDLFFDAGFFIQDIFSTADQTGIIILRSHNYLKIIYISFIECERFFEKEFRR